MSDENQVLQDCSADSVYDAVDQFIKLKHDLIDIKFAVKRIRKTGDFEGLRAMFEKAAKTAAAAEAHFAAQDSTPGQQ